MDMNLHEGRRHDSSAKSNGRVVIRLGSFEELSASDCYLPAGRWRQVLVLFIVPSSTWVSTSPRQATTRTGFLVTLHWRW